MSSFVVSTATLVTIVLGLVIAVFYLRFMWGALQKSVRTRNQPDDGPGDRYHRSLIGAVISVGLSIASIAIYGAGPLFLYWGPIVALLAAIAVAYALHDEVTS